MSPGAEERDDAALLRAVARGDEESLAALYDRHAGWLTLIGVAMRDQWHRYSRDLHRLPSPERNPS